MFHVRLSDKELKEMERHFLRLFLAGSERILKDVRI